MNERRLQNIRVLALTLVLALALTACGSVNRNDRNRPYDNDGLLGTTNTNPNLQTSPTYHHYGVDQDLVHDTLAQFPDVRNPRVIFNGATITVMYQPPDHYSADEHRQLETELEAALAYQLPRYTIRLNPDGIQMGK